MTIQELEQCISLYGKDIYSFCMHLAKEKESADDKAAEKYFTQIEEQKDEENVAAQKETDEDGTFTYQAYRPAKAQLKKTVASTFSIR